MRRLALAVVLCALVGTAGSASAGDLALLIPQLFGPKGLFVRSQTLLPDGTTHTAHFNSSFQRSFTPFNSALATQLSGTPLPSPGAGFTYNYDSSLGAFKRSSESFGPILSDRAETMGKGKLSAGVSYQYFDFKTIDGVDLGNVPVVFTHDDPAPGGRADVVTTSNAIDAKVSQFTVFLSYGLVENLDLSVAVPFESVQLKATSHATIQRIGTTDPATHYFDPPYSDTASYSSSGSASGVGDVLLRAKARILKRGATGLALGLDVRLPTGDEKNLLGTGTTGLEPFLALSTTHGRVAPHLKLGYQWNGKTVLAGDVTTGTKGSLPNQFFFQVGAETGLGQRATFDVDLLGRRVVDGETLTPVTFHALDNVSTFPTVRFGTSSYDTYDGSVGAKLNPTTHLLVDLNVLFKLNSSGLRSTITPLVGIEYSF